MTLVSLKYLHTPSSSLLAFFYLFFRIAQCASETSALTNEARVYFPSMVTLKQFSDRVSRHERKSTEFVVGYNLDHIESVEAESIHFSWLTAAPVLSGISFRLVKGDTLVIQGESGAGKSTLLSILIGLLEPTQGRILINGQNLESLQLSTFRNKLGYVGPESYIIQGTLRENLLFAASDLATPNDKVLIEALQDAQLKEGTSTK